MATTFYGDPGVSQRTNVYAAGKMLAHAAPVIVLDKIGGQTYPMPRNKAETIVFRRPRVFNAVTTPLAEGSTSTPVAFRYDDVSATLAEYGMLVKITSRIEDTHEDPVLNDIVTQVGENLGRTTEALTWGVLRAGTNVFYANGTARTDVNTTVTLSKLRAVVRSLKTNKAMKPSNILDSSVNYATRAVEGAFIAVCHTDLESDIRDLPGFLPVAQYGQRRTVADSEFGSVEELRFVTSSDLTPFTDGGGAKGSMVSTSGTSADVYPILIVGKEAFGTVPLRGQGAITPTILRPGVKDKADPQGRFGFVGWTMWFTAVRLNELWMARLEVAATAL
jgi:N4-gp56 family major capsid protein